MKSMAGVEGPEPPTHGLEILWPHVLPCNLNDLRVSSVLHSAAKSPH
jgi:hypothetical protein